MTNSWTEEGWTEPAKAVDLLEIEINRREERDPEANFWLDDVDDYLVVKCRYQSPALSSKCKTRRAQEARRSSRQLSCRLCGRRHSRSSPQQGQAVRDGRMNATDAEWEAAKKFAHLLGRVHRINIAPSTLRRRMQSIGPLKPDADDVAPGD